MAERPGPQRDEPASYSPPPSRRSPMGSSWGRPAVPPRGHPARHVRDTVSGTRDGQRPPGRGSSFGLLLAVSLIAASVAKYPHAETESFDAVQSEQAANCNLILTPAATIETKPTRWTWEDRIPAGEITLTVGLGGVGKSTFHAWMIAQVTKGLLPGLHWGTPMACIICAQEDSWGRTIVPRLIAADANLDMVYRVDVVEAGEDMRLTLPVDIEALTFEIEAKKVALVSLDPLMSLISVASTLTRTTKCAGPWSLWPSWRTAQVASFSETAISTKGLPAIR